MDELEKKAQKGLESFGEKGDIRSVKASLDGFVDDMLEEDEAHPKVKTNGKKWRWLYIFIVILGLAIIGYLGYKDGSKNEEIRDIPALYAQFFDVLPNAISANERGTEDEIGSDSDLGMEYYNKGDYKRAANLLTQQDDLDYLVFGAISEMKNDNHKSAIKWLLKSQQMDSANQYKDVIEWYLSLAYLKNENIKEATSILESIADGEHYKKNEAKSLLNSLE